MRTGEGKNSNWWTYFNAFWFKVFSKRSLYWICM